MNDPLNQLLDIDGLDTIHWWPLSSTWWLLLGLFIVLVISASYLYYRYRLYQRSWQKATLVQLTSLARDLTPQNSLESGTQISEVIRRIAIAKSSRHQCAGLEGAPWLSWLKAHDPHGFDWEENGYWLKDLIYAPPGTILPLDQLYHCINAIRRWIK